MASWVVRMSPLRQEIFFSDATSLRRGAESDCKKEVDLSPLLAEKLLDDESQRISLHGSFSSDSSGSSVSSDSSSISNVSLAPTADPPKPPSVETTRAQATIDGYPVVALSNCTVPDPRLSTKGHVAGALYFHAMFWVAVVMSIFRAATHDDPIVMSLQQTRSIEQLSVAVGLSISCEAPTRVTVIQNYSTESCMVAETVHEANTTPFFVTPLYLCYADTEVFSLSEAVPILHGTTIAFEHVPYSFTCVVNITTVESRQPIALLSIEGSVVKTQWIAYASEMSCDGEDDSDCSVTSSQVFPQYLELDGVRTTTNAEFGTPGSDDSSVLFLRLASVATVTKTISTGRAFLMLECFGQFWGLAEKITFVLVPLLLCFCPRQTSRASDETDAVDSVVRELIENAWIPETLAAFGVELFRQFR